MYREKERLLGDDGGEGYEAFLQELDEQARKLLFVYRVNAQIEADPAQQKTLAQIRAQYEHVESLGEIGGDRYYIAFGGKPGSAPWSEADQKDLEQLLAALPALRGRVMLFPA